MNWNGNRQRVTRSVTKNARRRAARYRRGSNLIRGLILETVGVIAIVAIFFLLRFEPADRPAWLFPEKFRQESSVSEPDHSSDGEATDRTVGKDFGLFSWQRP